MAVPAGEALTSLPPKEDTTLSPQEATAFNRYFGSGPSGAASPQERRGWKSDIKAAVVFTGLFLVLANPWIDKLLCNLPYCGGNAIFLLLAKAVIFLVFALFINRYFCD
jgi:hypothetical protein